MKRLAWFLGPQGFGAYWADLATHEFVRVDEKPDVTILPGFVDIHIHGGFGLDFMSGTSETLRALTAKLKDCGYEAFLPTTVTASFEDTRRALATLTKDPAMPGFHLEGPFISPRFPGAQPREQIAEIPTGPSEWDEVFDDPRLRVVTIAPEIPGALPLISRLASRGVICSMGHTNATFAEARAGFEAGVRHATHTFNAMRPFHHREAGAAGFAIAEQRLAAELIYDRIHVSASAAAILAQCKPQDKLIAVSDGTMASGMPEGARLNMWGLDVIVGNGDARLRDGTLAGSAITLLDSFRNLHADLGPEIAIRATRLNPRSALGLGKPNVYIVLDERLQIVERLETS